MNFGSHCDHGTALHEAEDVCSARWVSLWVVSIASVAPHDVRTSRRVASRDVANESSSLRVDDVNSICAFPRLTLRPVPTVYVACSTTPSVVLL